MTDECTMNACHQEDITNKKQFNHGHTDSGITRIYSYPTNGTSFYSLTCSQ